jgi:hypothetical protein
MLDWIHACITSHHKAFGIAGDSITFFASILLSLEALFKQAEWLSVESKRTIVAYFKNAEDADGNKIDIPTVESHWRALWTIAARVGTLFLALGFAILLALRIWSE